MAAEQTYAAKVDEARRQAVEEFRLAQAAERATAARVKEAARLANEPTSMSAKIKRLLGREVVPPALTRALIRTNPSSQGLTPSR